MATCPESQPTTPLIVCWIRFKLPQLLNGVSYALSDSTVVLCRDGSGCLYAVIQTKSRATPEQDRKTANEAYHDEAGTKQRTYITLLPSEGAPIRR